MPITHKLPSILAGQRQIVVVDGMAFYRSTGINSGSPGSWLPFLGCVMGRPDPSLPDTMVVNADGSFGMHQHVVAGWLIKPQDLLSTALIKIKNRNFFQYNTVRGEQVVACRARLLKAAADAGIQEGVFVTSKPIAAVYCLQTLYILGPGQRLDGPYDVPMRNSDLLVERGREDAELTPLSSPYLLVRELSGLYASARDYDSFQRRLSSAYLGVISAKLTQSEGGDALEKYKFAPEILACLPFADNYEVEAPSATYPSMSADNGAATPDVNQWIQAQGGYLWDGSIMSAITRTTGWLNLLVMGLYQDQCFPATTLYQPNAIQKRLAIDIYEMEMTYLKVLYKSMPSHFDLKLYLPTVRADKGPLSPALRAYFMKKDVTSEEIRDYCESIDMRIARAKACLPVEPTRPRLGM